jgi:hypothetical protein
MIHPGTTRLLRLLIAATLVLAFTSASAQVGRTPLAYAATCTGALSGSNFQSANGDLTPNPATCEDWNAPGSAAPVNHQNDLPSGSTDNAFGQGAKEDNTCNAVVFGSIPPNKSDLTRFYQAHERTGTGASATDFLYLAWERANVLGNANMDFEFNQSKTLCPNGVVPIKTAGDVLITFDFGGSGNPDIGELRWVTSGATSQCFAGSTLPCWGNRVDLTASGDANGAVNSGTVVDSVESPSLSLPAGTFGETGINLTLAQLFPPNACVNFGSVHLSSRSSSSFTSEIKDFIAPLQINLSNCGTITVIKQTSPRGLNQAFGFSTTVPSSATFSVPATNGNFTLNDTGNAGKTPGSSDPAQNSAGNTESITNVPLGTYTIQENSPEPAGFVYGGFSCTTTGTASATPASSSSVSSTSVTLANGNDSATCVYTNQQLLSPTITTQLQPASPVAVGTAVNDTATLHGATATAGGTVTYSYYTNNTCNQGQTTVGTVTVSNGAVPASPAVTFNSTGTWYWQAVYSGDTHNNGTKSDCTTEPLVVNPLHPTIATVLNATSIPVGSTDFDTATLTGATPTAGGTVTYTVYTDIGCTQGATAAGTVTVTNGSVPNSNTLTFNSAGTFHWQAVYSGDNNNIGNSSACTSEVVTVNPLTPSFTTAQSIIPDDSATLTGATPTAGGSITFSLYNPSDTTCANTAAFTQTVSVNGNGTYSTTNHSQATPFVATTAGTWRWVITYGGDHNNVAFTEACGTEAFTIKNS